MTGFRILLVAMAAFWPALYVFGGGWPAVLGVLLAIVTAVAACAVFEAIGHVIAGYRRGVVSLGGR